MFWKKILKMPPENEDVTKSKKVVYEVFYV
jgi:hypothetical protein